MKSNKKILEQIQFTYGKDSRLYKGGDLGEQYSLLVNEMDVLRRISCRKHFVLGSTDDGYGIALIWDEEAGDNTGVLTMEIFSEIISAAKDIGITQRPIYIHGTVNAGPNGSKSYAFRQMRYEHE